MKSLIKKKYSLRETAIEMHEAFMQEAIAISVESVQTGGGPFGALIVREGEVLARSSNSVTKDNDPTAHAEINAIRQACQEIGHFELTGCELYSSCEPCPMCLSAAYWAGIKKIYFANTRSDAKAIDFDDSFIYDQIPLAADKRSIPSEQLLHDKALAAFELWELMDDKEPY